MAQEPRESADTVHRVSVPFARGNAVETVISDRMMRGRPPLDCVQSEGDMYGVPAPDNWNDPKSDVVGLPGFFCTVSQRAPAYRRRRRFSYWGVRGLPCQGEVNRTRQWECAFPNRRFVARARMEDFNMPC